MGFKNWLADFLGKESKPISELYYEQKIPQVYYKELAIQTAISLIANAISKCEIKVFEKGEEVKNKLDDIYNNAFNHKEAKGVLEFLFE